MAEATHEIEVEIERARGRLAEDLNALEHRVRSEFDWRVHFNRHPYAFVGTAFGAALLLGRTIRLGRSH
jgi:hypothetical protein